MELDRNFKEFIQLLNDNNVQYIVVGGYAVSAHGYPRYTGDIDFWVKPDPENALKLEKVINDFGMGSLNIDRSDFIKEDFIIQLGHPPLRIDIITGVSGLNFDDSWKNKLVLEIQGLKINFISLYHLRINKKASGRSRDLNDLENLPEK